VGVGEAATTVGGRVAVREGAGAGETGGARVVDAEAVAVSVTEGDSVGAGLEGGIVLPGPALATGVV
jgi:hypothetical protein